MSTKRLEKKEQSSFSWIVSHSSTGLAFINKKEREGWPAPVTSVEVLLLMVFSRICGCQLWKGKYLMIHPQIQGEKYHINRPVFQRYRNSNPKRIHLFSNPDSSSSGNVGNLLPFQAGALISHVKVKERYAPALEKITEKNMMPLWERSSGDRIMSRAKRDFYSNLRFGSWGYLRHTSFSRATSIFFLFFREAAGPKTKRERAASLKEKDKRRLKTRSNKMKRRDEK